MNYVVIKEFSSKKNNVFLTLINKNEVVVKKFIDEINYKNEIHINNILYGELNIAKIISFSKNEIIFDYIKGNTLLELLEINQLNEKIILNLLNWIKVFYEKTNLILGDAHLRNFIYNDGIYGVDFEQVKKGEKEVDIASLIIFTLTYNPNFTQYKINIAKIIYQKSIDIFGFDNELLKKNLKAQINLIQNRRNKIFLNENNWSDLFNDFDL